MFEIVHWSSYVVLAISSVIQRHVLLFLAALSLIVSKKALALSENNLTNSSSAYHHLALAPGILLAYMSIVWDGFRTFTKPIIENKPNSVGQTFSETDTETGILIEKLPEEESSASLYDTFSVFHNLAIVAVVLAAAVTISINSGQKPNKKRRKTNYVACK